MKEFLDIDRDEIAKRLKDEGTEGLDPSAIEAVENALINYAALQSIAPASSLKGLILDKIARLNAQKQSYRPLDPSQLPLLNDYPNLLAWKELTKDIQPPAAYENIYLHTLESNEKRDLFVIWVDEYVPEEVHHDLLETFLILEGACTCFITDEQGNNHTVHMCEGDKITMQLGENHDIQITSSKPAKAILEWLKLAA